MTLRGVRAAGPDQRGASDKGKWEIIVGLEVHAQVTSQAKLFSGASAAYGGEPNAHVSLVDAAMPGMLPVINKFCVEQAIRTGLGLNAQINKWSERWLFPIMIIPAMILTALILNFFMLRAWRRGESIDD